jgi:predicted RNA binding protein YcfA (HicA-like mRNA interferase family)
MKRSDLIRTIEKSGAVFIRNGSNHDWYKNMKTGIAEAVPRHREIKEHLAKKIIKRLAFAEN